MSNIKWKGKTCKVANCPRAAFASGLCSMHYHRLARNGDFETHYDRCGKHTGRKFCTVSGCSRPAHGKGLCHLHYRRMLEKGSLERSTIKCKGEKCLVPSCDRGAVAKGYCIAHWTRLNKHGDVDEKRPITKMQWGNPRSMAELSHNNYAQRRFGEMADAWKALRKLQNYLREETKPWQRRERLVENFLLIRERSEARSLSRTSESKSGKLCKT